MWGVFLEKLLSYVLFPHPFGAPWGRLGVCELNALKDSEMGMRGFDLFFFGKWEKIRGRGMEKVE